LPDKDKVRKRWLRIGLLAAVLGFSLTFLAAWAEPWVSVCNFVISPGAVIVDNWLHISIWQPKFGFLTLTVDTLIYSGVFGLLLWAMRPLWRSH
jgi:hypothetical protein